MAKHYFVYSTLTADVNYASYVDPGNGMPQVDHSVLIRGGANVADRKTVVTPAGAVVTKITEKDLEVLNEIEVFQLHKRNGFIEVRDSLEDGEAVASDMEGRDASAPLVPEDFTGNDLQPIVGGTIDVAPAGDSEAKPRNSRKA